jgi:membrane peptidoglycan carboxypeptidase
MKYRVGLTDSKNRKRPSNTPRKRSGTSSFTLSSFVKFKQISNSIKRRTKISKQPGKAVGRGKYAGLKAKAKRITVIFLGVGLFIGFLTTIGVGIWLKNLQSSLPDPNNLVERTSDQSTQILDKDGKLLYRVYGDQNREFVSIDKIPDHTKWALLAAEDLEFYQHKGIDLIGIAQAAISNTLSGTSRGASTVSQQLVKTTILYDVLGEEAFEKTYLRKIKEVLITMQVEQNLSKDEILQLYMNEVPLGGVNYGFQAAAKSYFGKDVSELDLAESAMLSGLIQAPGYYSPLYGTNPEYAEDRQKYVLDQLEKNLDHVQGITQEDIDQAREQELVYKTADVNIPAPHFVFYVRQLLEEEYGADQVSRGGLKVITTLDQSVQKIAEEEVVKGVEQYGKKWGVSNGAAVVLDPKTGNIIAMMGSIDYNNTDDPKVDGNVNITTSLRQMGSSVKPYVYLTAFEKGYGPWLLTPDIKELKFGTYDPDNWDDRFYGLMTAREALIKSRNIPAIYTTQLIGVDAFLQTAEKVGITTLTDRSSYGLSIGLGAGEMKLLEHAGGFTVFANEGIKKDTIAILKVQDSKGEVLFEQEEQKGKRVFDEQDVYALNWVLCDLGGFGDQPFNNQYYHNGKRSYCGKTGTTNGPRDLVSIQYHKNLVVAVWAGNNNNVETPGAWSTTVPLPIVHAIMERVSGKYPPELYTRPSGISSTSVCNDTGAVPGKEAECKKVASIYIEGQSPPKDLREKIKVCKDSGKIPTNLTTAEKYGLIKNVIYISQTIENTFQQTAYEKYLTAFKDTDYVTTKPESEACKLPLGPGDSPVIEFTSPSSGATFDEGGSATLSVDIVVKESVSKVEYYYDGTLIDTVTTSPFSTTYTIPSGSGSHTFSATVTDNKGKTGNATRNITVSGVVSVSITSPSNGAVQGFPVDIVATASSGVTKVDFKIVRTGGGYSTTISDSNSADGWGATWPNPGGLSTGTYTISATATMSGSTYDSSPITITVTI